ncbi:MAG: T9SS type A sorting domain-containing protein [Bacteroidota bacterium]
MKKFFILIILIQFIYSVKAQWVQIGDDIDGEVANDWATYTSGLSISSDGNVVVVGAPFNDSNGNDAGHVRIYENIGGSWVQMGNEIIGQDSTNWLGWSVSLNADGKRVAISAPHNSGNGYWSGNVRVFEYNGANWIQVGNDINGDAEDVSGLSVSLNADGTRVAVGTPYNDGNGMSSGCVRVYEYIGSDWIQLSSDIVGENGSDQSGNSVSLNSNGDILAIGAHYNDGTGQSECGHVRIFEYSGGNWVQMGSDIDGEAIDDRFGFSVSLSSNGLTVAIGAERNDGNNIGSGHVRVFEFNSGNWIQIGNDIDGESGGDYSGTSVSLSSDGSIVAIGAPYNDGNGGNSGHVRVFGYSSGNWIQIGSDIDGENALDWSGYSVSLSADGSIVAIGAPNNYGNGTDAGHARIYSFSTSVSEKIIEVVYAIIYPNPNNGDMIVEYSFTEDKEGEFVVYNVIGTKMMSYKLVPDKSRINITNNALPPGIYLYKVSSGNNIIIEDKLVIIR